MLKLNVEIEGRTPVEVMEALHEATRRLSNGEPDYQDNGDGWTFFYDLSGADEAGEQLCESPFAHDLCSHD